MILFGDLAEMWRNDYVENQKIGLAGLEIDMDSI